MTKFVGKTITLLAFLLLYHRSAEAQLGPSASVTALNFTYQVNSATLPKAQTITITLPASLSSQTMVAVAASNPQGWLSVTPASGRTPLVLTATVNPTTLDPGNHSGTITIDTTTPTGHPAVVAVTIAISSPPSTIKVNTLTLAYSYVTGAPLPGALEVDVSSSGSDAIAFSVTAANASTTGGGTGATKTPVWLRVNQSGLPASLTTSGVAFSGSVTQIFVSLDPAALATLDPISSPFNGTITVAPTNAATGSTNSSAVVAVTLQVSPGPPTLRPVVPLFPDTIPATPATDPVITIYGDNFFGTTGVTIQQTGNLPITLNPTWLGRTVMQVKVNASYLSVAAVWTLTVLNANQPPISTSFTVTDPAVPIITSVVNSASFLPTAIQSVGANPVPVAGTSISPREIISIFGRNLGPPAVTPVTPAGTPPLYPTVAGTVIVDFLVGPTLTATAYSAPLIMVSGTQINCVVPKEVDGTVGPVTVRVSNGVMTPEFPVTVVPQDPGVFTFGGVGQGQAAVLNFDSTTGSFTVNSSTGAAARRSAVSIFVTGVGDLDPLALVANGAVAPASPILLAANPANIHVDIDGQPAVVTYAGTSPGAVAGLVQINAIVPLSSRAGGTIPVTVSIGTAVLARRSQPGVTMAVK